MNSSAFGWLEKKRLLDIGNGISSLRRRVGTRPPSCLRLESMIKDLRHISRQSLYQSSEGYSGSLEDYSDPGDSYYENEANSIGFLLNASEED